MAPTDATSPDRDPPPQMTQAEMAQQRRDNTARVREMRAVPEVVQARARTALVESAIVLVAASAASSPMPEGTILRLHRACEDLGAMEDGPLYPVRIAALRLLDGATQCLPLTAAVASSHIALALLDYFAGRAARSEGTS